MKPKTFDKRDLDNTFNTNNTLTESKQVYNKNKKSAIEFSLENNNSQVLDDTQTILNTFDFSPIDQLDPLMQDGHRVIFSKDVNVEIRQNNTQVTEKIKLRIILIGEEAVPANVRIEISSNEDVFFFYLCELDIISYRKLQETQKIQCNFGEFIPTVKKLVLVSAQQSNEEQILISNVNNNNFNNNNNINSNTSNYFSNNNSTQKQPKALSPKNSSKPNNNQNLNSSNSNTGSGLKDKYKMVLNVSTLDNTKLDFVKLLGHKEITVLSINFTPVNDEFMRKLISYKFNYTRSKIVVYQERINYVMDLLQQKNPTLHGLVLKLPAKLTEDYIQSKIKSEYKQADN